MEKCFVCDKVLSTIFLEGEDGNRMCIGHANLSEEQMTEINVAADIFVCPKSLAN